MQVHGDGEGFGAEALHRKDQDVLLEFSAHMFQIQNRFQNCLQESGESGVSSRILYCIIT